MEEHIQKWRLVLGAQADPDQDISLPAGMADMDRVLEALYDGDRKGGLGASSPKVNRWLGDIRRYFPTPVVQVMQRDALERLGIERMLLEPELLAAMTPDVHLVGVLLSLNKLLPKQTRETARAVVQKVVADVEKRLEHPLRAAVRGSFSRSVRNRRPRPSDINWHATIRANLKHYQPELKTIVPAQLIGYGRKGQQLKHIILLQDQSGSMAGSVVYAGVIACVLASLSTIKTRLIAFDTEVVDLSENLGDPVDLLFGMQLGGGTDIHRALTYAQAFIEQPADTILFLISDLFEGGNRAALLQRVAAVKAAGTTVIALLALSDEGAPAFDRQVAESLSDMGIPVFAASPDAFPALIAKAIKGLPLLPL